MKTELFYEWDSLGSGFVLEEGGRSFELLKREALHRFTGFFKVFFFEVKCDASGKAIGAVEVLKEVRARSWTKTPRMIKNCTQWKLRNVQQTRLLRNLSVYGSSSTEVPKVIRRF